MAGLGALHGSRPPLHTHCVLRDIGLFGPKMQKALADMGVLGYAAVEAKKILEDERVADNFDRRRFVQQQVAADPKRAV